MAEKILARNSGNAQVKAGQYVTARVDWLEMLDWANTVYKEFKEIGIEKVWDPNRITVDCRTQAPACSIKKAEQQVTNRRFVEEFGITHYDEVGRSGISHQTFPEKGFALPGTLIVGMDSHMTSLGAFNVAACGLKDIEACYVAAKGEIWFKVPDTIRFEISGELQPKVMGRDIILKIAGDYGVDMALYKSVEFVGPAVEKMSLSARWSIATMGVEIGAKFAIFEADEKTFEFLKGRTEKAFSPVNSDSDATFAETYRLDVTDLEPQVACPHDVDNVKPVSEVAGIPIDQAFLGTCASGRIEDLAVAAGILEGKEIHPKVRMIVIPGSVEVYKEALKTGLLSVLIDAGAVIGPPCCGPCGGGTLGPLAAGERCISTGPRNWKGRMGSVDAEIYIGSAATVAASALRGVVTDPRML